MQASCDSFESFWFVVTVIDSQSIVNYESVPNENGYRVSTRRRTMRERITFAGIELRDSTTCSFSTEKRFETSPFPGHLVPMARAGSEFFFSIREEALRGIIVKEIIRNLEWQKKRREVLY